ncbi:conserved hypothetical protein [Ricinus communis]|uniref:Uncharacterized protein n=1 Tax=Ricinus communis TaxID=3988 RepID=B9TP17_RICCO|nr:conserved hypothetical protein [Ricinus communis]
MMENKRSPCSVDQGTLTSLATKRHKADLSISTKVSINTPPLYSYIDFSCQEPYSFLPVS